MTVATSVVVALMLSIYAALDIRSASGERYTTLRNRVEDVALTLRLQVEASGTDIALADSKARSEKLTEAIVAFDIALLPASLGENAASDKRANRVRAMLAGRPDFLLTRDSDGITYSLPLRTESATTLEGYETLGILEVSVGMEQLDQAFRADVVRTVPVIVAIVATVFIAVLLLSRSLVTVPIAKLLTGVADVAHGDLSRVLLAEREDEIGDLAARFNEMTFSLRESRSETKRHNQARGALEQRLFQTEKLATIGQIAAEIAHEVGTPLNVIAGRARGMVRKSHDHAAVEKNATIVAEQADRITRIIQRLLDFSRRKVGAEEPQLFNLNTLALNTMEFLESKLSNANIKHQLRRAEDLPAIRGNPDQVLQILMNLVLNASEAMKEGGSLKLETSIVTRRRPGLEVAPEQPMVLVTVSDTGPGIPEEERDKIFEPFYSSKTHDGGTGLGLAVVHGIVKDHDGWIEVAESLEGGSCFSVFFPAVSA